MTTAILHEALLAPAIAGDRAALEQLLAATRGDLGRYARRHCQSQDVEDAVQDALWIIHQRLGSLRQLSSFAGWSFRIVRRLCLGLNRAEARRRALPAQDHRTEAPPPLDPETRLTIIAAIGALPEHYRSLLIHADILGHSAEACADRLGITLAATKARLHRARMMVRQSAEVTPMGDDDGLRQSQSC